MVFRIRELLIRRRTQAINALRGHLGEFGQIVPQGAANAARLIAIVEDPESVLPADAMATLQVLVAALAHLETVIGKLDAEIARQAKENEVARRLMTIRKRRLGPTRDQLDGLKFQGRRSSMRPCG